MELIIIVGITARFYIRSLLGKI